MFRRSLEAALHQSMKQYPVVTITGPRQSGKTTLAKSCCPDKTYYNLENPDIRAVIEADPRQFLSDINLTQGVILDEIQNLPELLSYIQVIVDEHRIPGAFILTGSHQLQLSEAISQSLAGRTALLELLPLSIDELGHNKINYTIDSYLLNGFFPAIYQHHLDPTINARNYIKTYVERDVRQIVNIKDIHSFQKFIKLCAGRVGSIINRENLSNEVGVAQNTIKNWFSILEASYLTYQLQPYFENFNKRIIKSSKLYFLDIGLASYLLDVKSEEQMLREKLRGNLFENMIILELIKHQYNHLNDPNIYFYRDSNGNEVDVLLQHHDKLIPIEIKSTTTFNKALLKGLNFFHDLVNERAPFSFLVYGGTEEHKIGNTYLLNYKHIHRIFELVEENYS